MPCRSGACFAILATLAIAVGSAANAADEKFPNRLFAENLAAQGRSYAELESMGYVYLRP